MRYFITALFFLFILWIIYLADTGQGTAFFALMAAIPYADKLGHVVLYGIMTFLLTVALRYRTVRLRARTIPLGALLVFSFALLEELTQALIPSRTLDIIDLAADVLGIGLFSLLAYRWRERRVIE